jgi:hypothetical protein
MKVIGSTILALLGCLAILHEIYRPGLPAVKKAAGERLVCYGPLTRVGSWFALYLGPIFYTLMTIFPSRRFLECEEDSSAFVSLCVVLPWLTLWPVWETTRSLVVSPAGLDCRSPWKARRFLPWADVRKVTSPQSSTSLPTTGFYVIHAADGWRFFVSGEVQGFQEFSNYCTRHSPPGAS